MKTPDPEEMSNAALTERNRELRHENAEMKQQIATLEAEKERMVKRLIELDPNPW